MSEQKKRQAHVMQVLLYPCVSEKSTLVSQHRQYVFFVLKKACRLRVQRAVELMFQVKVHKVNILNAKKRVANRRSGRKKITERDYKKAYITLKEGFSIDLENV